MLDTQGMIKEYVGDELMAIGPFERGARALTTLRESLNQPSESIDVAAAVSA